MRVIAKRTLKEYWERRPDTESFLLLWFKIAKRAEWASPAEVKETYADASILKDGRVVFNIMGNHHRLVVRINYQRAWIFIRFVGTHREYDAIDAQTI